MAARTKKHGSRSCVHKDPTTIPLPKGPIRGFQPEPNAPLTKFIAVAEPASLSTVEASFDATSAALEVMKATEERQRQKAQKLQDFQRRLRVRVASARTGSTPERRRARYAAKKVALPARAQSGIYGTQGSRDVSSGHPSGMLAPGSHPGANVLPTVALEDRIGAAATASQLARLHLLAHGSRSGRRGFFYPGDASTNDASSVASSLDPAEYFPSDRVLVSSVTSPFAALSRPTEAWNESARTLDYEGEGEEKKAETGNAQQNASCDIASETSAEGFGWLKSESLAMPRHHRHSHVATAKHTAAERAKMVAETRESVMKTERLAVQRRRKEQQEAEKAKRAKELAEARKAAEEAQRASEEEQKELERRRQERLDAAAAIAAARAMEREITAAERRTQEARRYIEALRQQVLDRLEERGLTLPQLCACSPTLPVLAPRWETCANNCAFHNNPRAYTRALQDVFKAMNLL